MPTSSVGKTSASRRVGRTPRSAAGPQAGLKPETGITLIEMVVVVLLISLIVGISLPALTSGIDTLRLNQATTGIVNFVNSGLNRAERRQQVVEIFISKHDNSLSMRSTEPGFARKLELPEGITITHVLPELPPGSDDPDAPRSFLLYPGGTAPRFGIQLANRRNVERIVRVDPITGVPRIEQPQP